MTGSSSAIQGVAQLLQQLRAQHTTVKAELESLEQRISAVQTTLQLLGGASTLPSPPTLSMAHPPSQTAQDVGVSPSRSISEWARLLRGMKQMDALRKIAQESGGTIRSTEAAHTLIATGLAKGKPRNVNSHIYHMLQDSGEFERTTPGTFRVIVPALVEQNNVGRSLGHDQSSMGGID